MAKIAINKMKLLAITLTGVLIGGSVFLYNKFFGGTAQEIPEGEYIVGQTDNQNIDITEKTEQESIAVAYAQTPAQGIQEVVRRTGNLDFVKPGQRVLVKPNVNSSDQAPGTTHPEALAEVVRLVKAKGAYVIVGDRSNPNWGTIDAMKTTGMYEAAEQAGADEIVGFEDQEWMRVKPEKAENWPNGFRIPIMLENIDHVISVPVLHTHSITSHSLSLKNLVGLIHADDRYVFHASPKIQEMISEISLAVNPSLTVIDGTKSFIDGGPSSGTLSEPKVYLASKDVLAADVTGVELLMNDGANLKYSNTWESPMIKRGYELSVGFLSKDEITEELERNKV